MKFLTKIKSDPRVAHLLRAVARFGNRLGAQFAAAITYFSVLSVVPILMVAFSVLGLTVTTFRPELMSQISEAIQSRFGDDKTAETLKAAITKALESWGTIGLIGLGSALYAGAGWISNLKTAVRAQFRPDFDRNEKKRMIVLEVLVNIAILFGFLGLIGLSVGASTLGTALNTQILHLLRLNAAPEITFLTWSASFLVSVISSTVLFLYIYRVMPQVHPKRKQWIMGSVFAGVLLAILQSAAGFIVRMFAGNAAASAFGPIIVIMLVFNLFAQLTLFIAAWIATTNQPAVAREYNEADEPLRHRTDLELADDHWAAADEDRREKDKAKLAKERGDKPGEVAPEDRPESAREAYVRARRREGLGPQVPQNDPQTMVPQDVAAKGVRAGMGAGYVVGAATGVGLGALAGRAVHAIANRRRKG